MGMTLAFYAADPQELVALFATDMDWGEEGEETFFAQLSARTTSELRPHDLTYGICQRRNTAALSVYTRVQQGRALRNSPGANDGKRDTLLLFSSAKYAQMRN